MPQSVLGHAFFFVKKHKVSIHLEKFGGHKVPAGKTVKAVCLSVTQASGVTDDTAHCRLTKVEFILDLPKSI